uniref:Protein ARV n=1 Tax=Candidozyma auris TaxID=498019 RepID=A0A0L0P7Q9_CANAR
MICVECTNPDIKQLFTEFKSKYIQMTVCPKCGKLADKYIEFDYVILFLDVLLLKPQAYRHLAFNVVEESLFFITDDIPFFERYKKLLRYATLTILFEVYLNWAYEERNDIHSVIVAQILQKPIPLQYMFFIFQQLAERIVLCVLIDKLLRTFAGWGRNPNRNLPEKFHRGYFVSVLLLTVFMSLSIKCIPIIMLIWPYDNPQVASVVVDILGLANTIEALRLIVGSSYILISTIVIVATLVLNLFRKLAVSLLLTAFTEHRFSYLFASELWPWLKLVRF